MIPWLQVVGGLTAILALILAGRWVWVKIGTVAVPDRESLIDNAYFFGFPILLAIGLLVVWLFAARPVSEPVRDNASSDGQNRQEDVLSRVDVAGSDRADNEDERPE